MENTTAGKKYLLTTGIAQVNLQELYLVINKSF